MSTIKIEKIKEKEIKKEGKNEVLTSRNFTLNLPEKFNLISV